MPMFGLSAEKEDAQDSQFDYLRLGIHTKITHKFSMFGLDSRVGFGLRFRNKDYQSVEAENLPARDISERDENRQVIEVHWDLHLLNNLLVVTEWVLENPQQVDQNEVSKKLMDLAQQLDVKRNSNKTAPVNNVVHISAWRKWTADIKTPYAMVAGVALVASVAILNLSQPVSDLGFSTDIA
jgi:hypothetical protein